MNLRPSPSSLWWQLSWKLTIVQGFILVLVNLGFIALVLSNQTLAPSADRQVVPAILGSIEDRDGLLVLRPTPMFSELALESPRFWFRAIDGLGRTVDYGSSPPEYDGLLRELPGLAVVDVRSRDDARLTAMILDAKSSVGTLRIFHGGRTEPGSPLWNLLSALKVLYLPSTLLPMLAALIAVPLIVRRALRGLDRTAETATAIGPDDRGARLPSEGVVDEVRPLVNAVNDAFRRVDEGYDRRRRFLANAAHELRTPIAVIQTRIETLPDGSDKQRLLTDAERLGSTAEQLLNMQRLDHEELRLVAVDLVDLCRQVVADLAPIAIEAGYDLSLTVEQGTVFARGHGASLSGAVTNLVMNAVEHAGGAGNIVVVVRADAAIEVADEGPGIANEHRYLVFEPFYRIRPKAHGAGLGLALVQEIASRHGGTVEILPSDHGARFRLKLGLAARP